MIIRREARMGKPEEAKPIRVKFTGVEATQLKSPPKDTCFMSLLEWAKPTWYGKFRIKVFGHSNDHNLEWLLCD